MNTAQGKEADRRNRLSMYWEKLLAETIVGIEKYTRNKPTPREKGCLSQKKRLADKCKRRLKKYF